MDRWSEVPDHFNSFSRQLSKVLDNIVFSPAQRDQNMKTMETTEILMTFKVSFSTVGNSHRMEDFGLAIEDGFPFSFCGYRCGSMFEGTTSPGLQSDMDLVHVSCDLPVVTNKLDAQQYQGSYMLVQDPNTPAGYAKLQHVIDGVPLFTSPLECNNAYLVFLSCDTDAEGRHVLRSDTDLKSLVTGVPPVRHGPAETFEMTIGSIDYVVALRCKTWPDCAAEWLTRQRHHNWPTQSTIDKCKALDCFLVPVGHPNSSEKHLEWRISFSLQERLLVTNFNDVQLKCYVLLKMIKKEKIHTTLGEKSLTSYHFKTCLLYMIENTPAEVWVEDNLLGCLYNILNNMLTWVEAGECPNYFIPKENMFKGRLPKQVQAQLSLLLRWLLSMDFKFLSDIKCDMLGCRLREAFAFGAVPYTSVYLEMSDIMLRANQATFIHQTIKVRNQLFKLCEDKHTRMCIWRLYVLKSALERTEMETDYTSIRDVLSLIVPGVDIMLMSTLIVLAKSLSKSSRFTFTLVSEKWDAASFDYHRSELKLKQASLMYMLGHSEMSLEILVALEDKIRHQVSVCGCRITLERLISQLPVSSVPSSYETLLSGHLVHCSAFLPAVGDLAPLALRYEMNRSIGSPPEGKEDWHDWAVVDGKVLLYFLLYLNHHQLGMAAHAAADTDNIRRLIQTEEFMGHRETAYNLLGWIYKERGLVDKAIECFQKSLVIRPTHNAALLLLAFEICAKVHNTQTPSQS